MDCECEQAYRQSGIVAVVRYPGWEIGCGLVPLRNGELSFLWWLICSGGHGSIARNGNTSPPEVISDAADLEINVVHLAKLLRSLLVVAP